MGILKNLQNVFRTVRPPCARCPYRLGLVVFVQSPCPACRMDGTRAGGFSRDLAGGDVPRRGGRWEASLLASFRCDGGKWRAAPIGALVTCVTLAR